MKYRMLFLLLLIVVPLQCGVVQGAYQLEYIIEVHADGSAVWIIEQKGIGIEVSFERFVKNVSSLVNAAKEKTERDMIAKDIAMNVNVSGSYKAVSYRFNWEGFSEIEGSRIKIGDVFKVENFFSYLYGDGSVYIKYPQEYVVESVSPTPHKQDYAIPMLEWYGIRDFGMGEPRIVLKEKSASWGFLNVIRNNAILIIGLLALISVGGSVSLYYFKFRKREVKKETVPKMLEFQRTPEIENDEEKVVNLLKAAGGRLYQSTIADQCGFSRSKTSKLLKAMEDKGKIKREEKGREKVVTLLEKAEDDR
jgi:hypothetical protein